MFHAGGKVPDERFGLRIARQMLRGLGVGRQRGAGLPKEMTPAPYNRNPEATAFLARVYALRGEGDKALPLLEEAAGH